MGGYFIPMTYDTLSAMPLHHTFSSGNSLQFKIIKKEGRTEYKNGVGTFIYTAVEVQETTTGLKQHLHASTKPQSVKYQISRTKDTKGNITNRLLPV